MVPPGPIPNPEVKHQHVDGSRTTGPARVDSRQGSNEAPEPKGSGASSVSGVEYFVHGGVVLLPSSQVASGAPPAPHPRKRGQTAARFG